MALIHWRNTLLAISIFLFVPACEQKPEGAKTQETRSQHTPIREAQILAFGTLIDFTASGVTQEIFEQAHRDLTVLFSDMHENWHAWEPGALYALNQKLALGEPATTTTGILELIRAAKPLAQSSQNLFNPALGKLFKLWGFQKESAGPWSPPESASINTLINNHPELADLRIDGNTVRTRNKDVALDFGAFAKGYGLDIAMAHLQALGIQHAILNAGGDLRIIGNKSGADWQIAIRAPDNKSPLAVLSLQGNQSVFTSGDYLRYHEKSGKHYGHIIDPRSGYPASGVRSVTVLHENGATADAAATALFVAGSKNWPEIARRMGINFVMLVDDNNVWYVTPAMAEILKPLRKPAAFHIVSQNKH